MLNYNANIMGNIEIVFDGNMEGKFDNMLQIRQGNCTGIIIGIERLFEDGEEKIFHHLMGFFADRTHIRNLIKAKCDILKDFNVKDIWLNLAYEECFDMLRYFTEMGYMVHTYKHRKEE